MLKIISQNRVTGVSTVMEDQDDNILIHTAQDAEPVLRLNAVRRAAGRQHYAHDKDMHHLASIPCGIVVKWIGLYGFKIWETEDPDFDKNLAKILNDPEWRHLKTAEVVI